MNSALQELAELGPKFNWLAALGAHSSFHNALAKETASDWPKRYAARFIEAGLVYYQDIDETLLVQKPALDKMLESFVGKPVVNVVHKDARPDNFKDVADGVVSRVWYDPSDNWYWCEFVVWDEATQRNCESAAYSVSCAYTPLEWKTQKGVYHNLPYDEEVLDGEYTHLAIVANPRYEGARIIANSKEGGPMKLRFWKKDVKNAADLDVERATVEIDGKQVALKELINSHKEAEVAKLPALENMSDETVIEIDGKETTVGALKEVHKAALVRKNAVEEELKKKEEEKRNADEEKKKKEDEEKRNADEKAKKDKEEAERKNAADAAARAADPEGKARSEALKNAADRRGEPQTPKVVTQREQAEEGKKRYGSNRA